MDDGGGPAAATTPASPSHASTPLPEEARAGTPQPERDAEDLAVAEAFVVAVGTGDDATRARLAEGPAATPPPAVEGSSGRDPQADDVEVVQMSSHVISGQGDRSIIQVLADLTSPAGDSIGQWRVAVTRFDGEPVVTGFGAG